MTDRSRLQNRVELLGTCAMIAVAIGLANSSESFAQSALQGTPTVASGDAFINRGGPSGGSTAVDTISLNSQSAIINWNTFDQSTNTPIDFLPQNTVARFQGGQNFVVLNRVFAATPGQAISLNGTVLSQDFSSQRTGSVWFYSPGGIIAGPSSVFNVGNLILTADDIDTTNGLFGPSNTIRFRGGAGSTSAVTVQPGAQMNLTAVGSYLALVAPQVTMGGTANVNGSAAYIAAEQVDVRINGGAFDIAFVTGTGVANALTHLGTTTGPAAANGTIAMAAMPKNTAITMLVGGTVGYTPAATATVQNGTIILSAGQDVVFGTIGQAPSATAANLTIGSGTFQSEVNAQATNILASPNGGSPLSFTGNGNLTGLTSAEVRADAGETITVGGDLTLVSRRPGVGGTARLIADGAGSQITVNGQTQVDASAFGVLNFAGPGGNAIGGTAEVVARRGNMFLGTTLVTANGTGGYGTTRSGNGTGGIARVRAEQTTSFGLLSNDLTISAFGQGGQGGGQFPQSPIGGNAVGGQALFEIANQGFASTAFLTIVADATGGTGGTANGIGGNAAAGTAQIDMGTGSLSAGQTIVSANELTGFAGFGGTTGSTSGAGIARVRTQSGTVRLDGLDMSADARPVGGVRDPASTPAIEGTLRAGTAEVLADRGTISAPGFGMSVSASAFGPGSTFAVSAGPATGGAVNVRATNGGSISSLGIFLQSLAFGTATTTTAGNATAGTINLSNSGGSSFSLDPDDSPHDIRLDAYAVGTSGAAPAAATGGQITIDFGEGRARGVQIIGANATGFAGSSTIGGNGASGRGGNVDFTMNPGSDIVAIGVLLTADGASVAEREGSIGPGPGSAGFGGAVRTNLLGGALTTDSFSLSASGRGAYAFAAPATPGTVAGTGSGGSTTFTVDGATATIGSIDIGATGTGGQGGDGSRVTNINASAGGVGIGGAATLQLNSGSLNTNTINVSASGTGGAGGAGDGKDGGTGGTGSGGTAMFRNVAGSAVTTNAINVFAQGIGGFGGGSDFTTGSGPLSLNGGSGGAGTGGTALIDWQGEAVVSGFNRPALSAIASGEGADGADGFDTATGQAGTFGGQGGDGTGGTATIRISGSSTEFGTLIAGAYAYGGDGGIGNATRRGGDATGGVAEVIVTDTALVAGIININSFALAGDSKAGRFGTGPRGADATGGSSLFEVSGSNGSYVASAGAPFAYGGAPTLTLASDAYATDGISGSSGTSGGAGGRGGNAKGGQAIVRATDGLVDLRTPSVIGFYVDAVGGNAGNGGNASTYQPTGGGAGGDGGTGEGGSITFTADGGRLFLGNLAVSSGAIAGSAGYGGFDTGRAAVPGTPASPGIPATPGTPAIPPAFGGFGIQSFGTGGTIAIESLPGSASGLDAQITGGNVTASVGASTTGYGDFGIPGTVSITNSNAGGGILQLGSLSITAGMPNSGFSSGSANISAIAAPIAIGGDLTVSGPIGVNLQSVGAGTITAGGIIDIDVEGFININGLDLNGQPAVKATSIRAAGGLGIYSRSAPLFADNDITLSSAFGTIDAGDLKAGRDIGITALNGNLSANVIDAGRNAVLIGSPTFTNISVNAATTVGGFLEARGASVSFPNITAGTDAILSSFNGALTVGDVTVGDDIFLTVNGSNANPNTVSPDSQTGVVSTTQFALTAGNLRSTGLGSDTAGSGPATFAGAGPTGNVIRIRASGTVQTRDITTGGTAIVVSDLASLATGSISAAAGVGFYVRANATAGNITTDGTFWLGDSSQVFGFVPSYQVVNFAPFQTPTNGSATLGAVSADLIRGTVRDSFTLGSSSSIGDTLWTTGTSTVVGGSLTSGSLTTGASLTLRIGGDISFTTANAGTTSLMTSGGAVTGASTSAVEYLEVSSQTGITLDSAISTVSNVGLGTASNTLRAGTVRAATEVSIYGANFSSPSANIVVGSVTSGTSTRIETGTTDFPASITAGTITTGSFLEARGGTLSFGNVTSGTDAILSSFAGPLTVGNVTAGDDLWLSVFGTTPFALTTGTLRSTGLGDDTAFSGAATFGNAGPAGNVIRVRSSGSVTTGDIVSTDRIILVSDLARVTTGSLTAPGGIAALARTGAGLGAVDTNGLFIVRSSDQSPLLTTNYEIAALNVGTVPNATFQTLGPVNLTTVRAASVQVNADAAIGYNTITTTGQVNLGNAYATQGNNVTGGAIVAGGIVGILSTGNIDFTSITTPTNASIAGSGAITGTSLSASTFSLSGRTGINVTAASATAPASSPGFSTLQATNGAINVPNLQSFTPISAFGRSVFARGPGALIFNVIQATAENIDIATTGNLTVDQARALGNISLTSAAGLSVNVVDAGYNFALQTSGFAADATLAGANVSTGTSVASGRFVTINATDTATLNGTTNGRSATAVNSSDIVISTGATLGGVGTRLTLTNTGAARTFIGDVAGTGGWRLDAAEIGRITANNIFIVAPVIGGPASTTFNSARTPDVTVGSFTARVGQQIGGEGTFDITTAGKVRVTGAVTFDNMGSDATVAIRGDEAVEILDAGRIVLNGANALVGTLDLTSRNIVAASSAALTDFGAATTLTAISDRAGRNDGIVNEGGYLQAGGIRATLLNSTLIIQNSGTGTTAGNRDFASRRGFTVGAGGFTIVQGGTNPVRVAINGRQIITTTGAAGTPTASGFTSGLDLIPLIRFIPSSQQSGTPFTFPANGATAAQRQAAAAIFDPLSTVNGCTIVSSSSCQGTTTVNDPIRDVLAGDFGEGAVANLLPVSIIQLKDYSTAGDEPLIDEPVTGAGNDDLWLVDDSTACDPAKEVCK